MSETPSITDPNDIAFLSMLKTATVAGSITLPSGLVLNAEQFKELAADA